MIDPRKMPPYLLEEMLRYVPRHLQEGLRLYIEEGRPVGDFLTALLEDSLTRTWKHADLVSRASMSSLLSFLYNSVPAPAWGSHKKVQAWLAHRGMAGAEMPIAPSELESEAATEVEP